MLIAHSWLYYLYLFILLNNFSLRLLGDSNSFLQEFNVVLKRKSPEITEEMPRIYNWNKNLMKTLPKRAIHH